MTTPDELADAYARCEQITRAEAANFSYGIRLLPPDRRAALSAIYALARRIDDVADSDLPVPQKRVRLAALRDEIAAAGRAAAGDGEIADPVLRAVVDAAGRLPIPLGAFDELVEGADMDLETDAAAVDGASGQARYADAEELVRYCRCVAGSVGRLCLGVFTSRPHPNAESYADSLGVALQLTNILRDIREDLQNGRVYLPQADLDRFGVQLRLQPDGALADDDGRLSALIRAMAAHAEAWYVEGLRLLPLLDARSAACTAAMAGIYRRLLARIAADPSLVLDRRLSLSGRQKAAVAARALVRRAA